VCDVSPLSAAPTARVTTHDPQDALFRFASAKVLCSFAGGARVLPCNNKIAQFSGGGLVQAAITCDSDPQYQVAMERGSAQFDDPAGHAVGLETNDAWNYDFTNNSGGIGSTSFTPGELLTFAAQATALGFAASTTSVSIVPTLPVPDVAGLTADNATMTLNRSGFTDVVLQNEASGAVPSGLVTRTDPAAGQAVAPATRIAVFVSTGASNVGVPSEIGKPAATATNDIQALGLTVSQVSTVDAANAGLVVDQKPAAGTQVAPGSTVELVVATG
jgi:hypothetical protein